MRPGGRAPGPVRVAVVEPTGHGGMAHYAYQLCQGLAMAGSEVTLLTSERFELARMPREFRLDACLKLRQSASASASGRWAQGARRAWRALLYYREWIRVIGRLLRFRPDVVQLGDLRFAGDAVCVGLLAAFGFRLADVCHNVERFAAGGSFASGSLERSVYRWLYRRCARVFVHYPSNRTRFLALYGGDPARVVAIPHGNEEVFALLRRPGLTAADLRWRLRLPQDALVVLQLGSLSRYKGCDLAVEALARVRQVVPEAHLVIAGHPLPDFETGKLVQAIQRLDLGPYVSLVDQYVRSEEIAAWLEMASVALFPYREVFQSGSLALAQTFGVPSVATDVGAMAEAAGDGALLVAAPPSPARLAEALARVLVDRGLAARLGSAARQRAATVGDWRGIGATVRAQYEGLLARAPEGAILPTEPPPMPEVRR